MVFNTNVCKAQHGYGNVCLLMSVTVKLSIGFCWLAWLMLYEERGQSLRLCVSFNSSIKFDWA